MELVDLGGSIDWMRLVDIGMGCVSGGLVLTGLRIWHQRTVERNQRRERSAPVLAAVKAFVADLRPSQLSLCELQDSANMVGLKDRHVVVRDQWRIVTLAHPSHRFRRRANRFDRNLVGLLRCIDRAVEELPSGREWWTAAPPVYMHSQWSRTRASLSEALGSF